MKYVMHYAVGYLALVHGMMSIFAGTLAYIVALSRGGDSWSAWISARDVAMIFFAVLLGITLPAAIYRMHKANKRLGVTFADLDRMSRAELEAFHERTKAVFKDK